MENEATLSEEKQKAVSVAQMQQKLTTFEEIFSEATPEERRDLLSVHINYLVYTPDGISLALFRSCRESDRSEVQRDGAIGSGGGIWTPDLWVMSPTSYQAAPPRDPMSR